MLPKPNAEHPTPNTQHPAPRTSLSQRWCRGRKCSGTMVEGRKGHGGTARGNVEEYSGATSAFAGQISRMHSISRTPRCRSRRLPLNERWAHACPKIEPATRSRSTITSAVGACRLVIYSTRDGGAIRVLSKDKADAHYGYREMFATTDRLRDIRYIRTFADSAGVQRSRPQIAGGQRRVRPARSSGPGR